MASLHKTPALIIRTVKFGETSLVVTAYTELFGIQGYIVNGVRLHTKKGAGKASLFQPSALLDMVVYHHESAHLNRIKEFQWRHIYQHILSDVKKNAVALFMVELLNRCLRQPEPNPDLFAFIEDAFLELDKSSDTITANMPLFFSLHLCSFLGFRIIDNYSEKKQVLDLAEGSFTENLPSHVDHLEGREAAVTAEILRSRHPGELEHVKMNHEFRRRLLQSYEKFYALHVSDFLPLRTVEVLKELW